ncbi:MAG: hypothetical protein OMM_04480 [Candidatus Magnetoglobus multicellularis str. Araruama]|uniref:DUF4276 family protein n=1 Tax=Candidatus Magnetoglobus multicellularis str. Araruama TaxID=890399 RepID=A0A1V1P135_9BACT|nr:MAG: hypothetical protein OMM_04480 [Candidatus Magnetoglobus multicellularis str. Araruama]
MNLYFLVEGKTERILYPKWLEYLVPSLKRIVNPYDASKNCYYLISGEGYPGLLDNHLLNSAKDINNSGAYNYFVIVLDSDEVTVNERVHELNKRMIDERINIGDCKLKIIVQNRCIETWLLGNRNVFTRYPTTQELIECIGFFDVYKEDPELMTCPTDRKETISAFHYDYLRLMLSEKNIRYTKKRPKDTLKPYYINELKKRLSQTPGHLYTLNSFFYFCTDIRKMIEKSD